MKNINNAHTQIKEAVNERLEQGYAGLAVQLQEGEVLHEMKNSKGNTQVKVKTVLN